MTKSRFEKAARINRLTALWFTIFFHVSLIGGAIYFSGDNTSVKDLVPEVVKEWFDAQDEEKSVQPVKKKDKNRA